jgi:2-oxoacid:acceptor oxidoreductase gamma subunit (pyruvate/2-ketoisovalerate family)
MKQNIIEILWHGRGGQGAITAAKIVANVAFDSGYSGVAMSPTFGTERRGAPIQTSLKISKDKIYDLSPIEEPDIVVVLDHLLLEELDVTSSVKPGGLVVINTPKPLDDYDFDNLAVAVADVTTISGEVGLKTGIVNSGIIGAFSKASGLLDIDSLIETIKDEFRQLKPDANAEAARVTFGRTSIGGRQWEAKNTVP